MLVFFHLVVGLLDCSTDLLVHLGMRFNQLIVGNSQTLELGLQLSEIAAILVYNFGLALFEEVISLLC